MSAGRRFQTEGAAKPKARSPVTSWCEERRVCRSVQVRRSTGRKKFVRDDSDLEAVGDLGHWALRQH